MCDTLNHLKLYNYNWHRCTLMSLIAPNFFFNLAAVPTNIHCSFTLVVNGICQENTLFYDIEKMEALINSNPNINHKWYTCS